MPAAVENQKGRWWEWEGRGVRDIELRKNGKEDTQGGDSYRREHVG